MATAISEELVEFIQRTCALYAEEEITSSTRMQSDLSLYGHDAVEFLVAYAQHFQVDVTNFMAADYFDSEGLDVPGIVLGWFRSIARQPASQTRKELTVDHLQRGIDAKCLNEQVIAEV